MSKQNPQPFAKIFGTLTTILGAVAASWGWSSGGGLLLIFGSCLIIFGLGFFVVGRFQE